MIGFKYCGGCNPKYKREFFLETYKKKHCDEYFEYAEQGVHYDKLIVICGCTRRCANVLDYSYDAIIYVDETNLNNI